MTDRLMERRSMRHTTILLVCISLAAVGCGSDLVGPTPLTSVHETWYGEATAGTSPTADECRVPNPPEGTIPWSNDAPALETYCAAFWVTQGEDYEIAVRFAPEIKLPANRFLQVFIPEGAQFVDSLGTPLPDGTRVRVTVAIHPTLYAVRFGPHGSGFTQGRPAVLKLNYSWADLDKKDAKDLTIYYQSDQDAGWEPEPTTIDKKGNFVTSFLYHFSNYAVAW